MVGTSGVYCSFLPYELWTYKVKGSLRNERMAQFHADVKQAFVMFDRRIGRYERKILDGMLGLIQGINNDKIFALLTDPDLGINLTPILRSFLIARRASLAEETRKARLTLRGVSRK